MAKRSFRAMVKAAGPLPVSILAVPGERQKKRRRPTTSRRRPHVSSPMQPETVRASDPTCQRRADLLDVIGDVASLKADLQAVTRQRELIEARCGVIRMREDQLAGRIDRVHADVTRLLIAAR